MSWRIPSHFPPLIEDSVLSQIPSAEFLEDGSGHRNLKPVSTYQKDYTKGIYNNNHNLVWDEIVNWVMNSNLELQKTKDIEAVSTESPAPQEIAISLPTHLPPLSHSGTTAGGGHSEMHESYQIPQTTKHLKGNTSRYGCSSNYVKAACGVVPTLHPIVNAPNYQTWYANEFGVGNACGFGGYHRPPTPFCPLHLPPIVKERKQLTGRSARLRPHKHRHNNMTEKREDLSPAGLSWLSEWAGPM